MNWKNRSFKNFEFSLSSLVLWILKINESAVFLISLSLSLSVRPSISGGGAKKQGTSGRTTDEW